MFEDIKMGVVTVSFNIKGRNHSLKSMRKSVKEPARYKDNSSVRIMATVKRAEILSVCFENGILMNRR